MWSRTTHGSRCEEREQTPAWNRRAWFPSSDDGIPMCYPRVMCEAPRASNVQSIRVTSHNVRYYAAVLRDWPADILCIGTLTIARGYVMIICCRSDPAVGCRIM